MNELLEIIKNEIKDKGPISFERFMDLALYHTHYGYYSSGKVRIGKDGDFYTSPCVHSAFGEVIANFISKSFEALNENNFSVLEIGAGKGYLALDVLDSLQLNNTSLYDSIKYSLIELNPKHLKEARKLLKKHKSKINWYKDLKEIKKKIKGVIVSNEVFDSLPFHRLKVVKKKLQEIFITLDNEGITETIKDITNKSLIKYFDKYNVELEENQEIEVNLHAEKLFLEINRILEKGLILTIDYGSLADEIYRTERMKGTYKCFFKHSIGNNPYINIGKQDITASVDFGNLLYIGNKVGIQKIKYTTQGQFLVDWGIIEIIERYSKNYKEDKQRRKNILAIKNLFMPDLMGNKFKALIQCKNAPHILGCIYPKSKFKISFNIS